jgi:hypothetical protein
MSRPPEGAVVACTVPLWTVAMDDTQGEAETEAIVAGAVVKPGERQEQPVDLVGWCDPAGVDDSQQGRAVVGGGRDGDGAARYVVALGVVEQVRDEPFE